MIIILILALVGGAAAALYLCSRSRLPYDIGRNPESDDFEDRS